MVPETTMVIAAGTVASVLTAGATVAIMVVRNQRDSDQHYMTRSDCSGSHRIAEANCRTCKSELEQYARTAAAEAVSALALERSAIGKELSDIKNQLATIMATQEQNAEMVSHLMRVVEEFNMTRRPK